MAVPFAPIPPATVRLSLAPEEWTACLDAWLTLAECTLQLSKEQMYASKGSIQSIRDFLRSYYRELSHSRLDDQTLREGYARPLFKACFDLISRLWDSHDDRELLLDWAFLRDFCHSCRRCSKAHSAQTLLERMWLRDGPLLEGMVQAKKTQVLNQLQNSATVDHQDVLGEIATISHAVSHIGAVFMTGTDFVDALVDAYADKTELRPSIVLVLYTSLRSLLLAEPPQISLLADDLYSLKAAVDSRKSSDENALVDLCTNTILLSRLRKLQQLQNSDRLFKVLRALEPYQKPGLKRPAERHRMSKTKAKGKGRATRDAAADDRHTQRNLQASQVLDLFPDLDHHYVVKLLDAYDGNIEQLTSHLLEGTLPPHLQNADKVLSAGQHTPADDLAPRSTPPLFAQAELPTRRNIYDNDDFDRLAMDTSRLHIGKRDKTTAGSAQQPNKSAIFAALAAFDSDDDERDDTYDVDDVGGTVDTAHPDGEPGPIQSRVTLEENDMALFKLYTTSPELFGRTFDVRKGQARQALKAETGMTDEAIEGWAIMLGRDAGRKRRLEQRFGAVGAFDGRQAELVGSSWQASAENTEESDNGAAGRGGFRGRGRGRGRGGRGRGGNVAGPSGEAGTAQAQRRKEENKGSRANHNRRDQRARKMARGGGNPFAG